MSRHRLNAKQRAAKKAHLMMLIDTATRAIAQWTFEMRVALRKGDRVNAECYRGAIAEQCASLARCRRQYDELMGYL